MFIMSCATFAVVSTFHVERPFIPDVRLNLFELPDVCTTLFRFDPYEILHMCNACLFPAVMYTPDRDCFFAYEGLCVALHKLAFPTRGSSGVALFGRSAPALSRIRRYFMTYFVGRFGSLIQFDPLKYTARLPAWAAAIHGKLNAGYHNGFIDCKLVGVARPTPSRSNPAVQQIGNYNAIQQALYSGHKRKHGLKFESITGAHGLFMGFSGGWDGRRHDSHILGESGTLAALALLLNYALYGDSGYPLRANLLVPWLSPPAGSMAALQNTVMAALRITVEWGFGIISNLWSATDFKRWMRCFLNAPALQYTFAALVTTSTPVYVVEIRSAGTLRWPHLPWRSTSLDSGDMSGVLSWLCSVVWRCSLAVRTVRLL